MPSISRAPSAGRTYFCILWRMFAAHFLVKSERFAEYSSNNSISVILYLNLSIFCCICLDERRKIISGMTDVPD